jgi:hypothetical protein
MKTILDVAEQIRPRKITAIRDGKVGFSNEL